MKEPTRSPYNKNTVKKSNIYNYERNMTKVKFLSKPKQAVIRYYFFFSLTARLDK
jgi:hypothetical protein